MDKHKKITLIIKILLFNISLIFKFLFFWKLSKFIRRKNIQSLKEKLKVLMYNERNS